jgi:acyl dehydratase
MSAQGLPPDGESVNSGSRTITDVEIALLPAMMGAISPLFHDEPTAQASRMKGRVLYGPALLGIAVALTEPLLHDEVIGLVEVSRVKFRRPVHVGDTVTTKMTVTGRHKREGRSGQLISVRDEVTNQHGDVVLDFERTILIKD